MTAALKWGGAIAALLWLGVACDSSDDDRTSGGNDGERRLSVMEDAPGGASGDGDSGDGASGSGDDDGIGKGCASTDQDARLTQANLLFVVDRSGSMNCNAPQYTMAVCDKPEKQRSGDPSKWEETQAAISGALESLPIGAENVNVGLHGISQA